MAQPSEKLAASLEALHELQQRGVVAIRARDLKRADRERLMASGFLQGVMKGWYIPAAPGETPGDTTAWYTTFWTFSAAYLNTRFGTDWCLSPEQSLLLHTGNYTVPRQLLVRSQKARNKVTNLLYGTSLFDLRLSVPEIQSIEEKQGLRLFSLSAALIASSANFFQQSATDARAALCMIRDASDILESLLNGGHSIVAGRLAGAFRNVGRNQIADNILKTMRAAGYDVRETDPFGSRLAFTAFPGELSPYVYRVKLMWKVMREDVIRHFPDPPARINDVDAYLRRVEETYITDAYHSLSIEGYRVSPQLIERVRAGSWNPEADEGDRQQLNALAARGYWQAFQKVKTSLKRALDGENPGAVVQDDHESWHRELFAPCVAAGLLRPAVLAGYRNGPVYIRRSRHVPPNRDAVRDLMPTLFDLLRDEAEPSVRIVLGHFVFVYIHPYGDGNGRMGRFLMNVMLGAGGYPWTVIPVQQRADYMTALENASVGQDILPLATFLGDLVKAVLEGHPAAKAPEIAEPHVNVSSSG